MSVVTGALGSLAPKLLQLLHGEYKLQKDVRNEVESLSRELESIYAFLGKVGDVPWDRLDEQVKVWAREVREASYDMEDVIDAFLIRVDGRKNNADSSSLRLAMSKMGDLFSKAKARHDIAAKVKDISKRLEEVAENRRKYKLDEIMCKPHATTSTIDPRLKAMYKEVTQLIGVDKSRDELMSMLNQPKSDHDDSNKKMKMVSVVGVGGLGKTTLAKAVYDKLKPQYDCAAFVSIGRDHDLVKVFMDILFHLDSEKHMGIHNSGRSAEVLIHQLREFLEKKRYFIVIDDVWEVRTWEAIELALVQNNHGSIVITTTRNVDVAEASGDVYKLKALSYDDSTKLFSTRLSIADQKFLGNQSNDISKKILKKCAGIPLAIITMASLLAGKPECQWSMVYNSIGFHTRDHREAEDTMIILSFSYYDLPPHLKTCLLYLSTYPEDYEIGKDSLIRKWIAEGFINGDQGTRLFEVGERYFNDLTNRSLIQVVENEWDGTVSCCRVHDMVLDLIRKLSSKENFVAILNDNVEGIPTLSNVRRLAHQSIKSEHIISEAVVTRMPKVRSYIAVKGFIAKGFIAKGFIARWDQLLRFKLLRVLDIIGCKLKEGCHLEHLGDLLYLRYLGIRCQGLPKQIGNLKLLQTLDVEGTLPASIVHLPELVCLRTWNMVPDGIGKLVSLEELRIQRGSSDHPNRFFKELGSLRELRVLQFKTDGMDEGMQRDFLDSLSNLQKIQHIQVYSSFSADTAMWEAAGFVLLPPLQCLKWPVIKFSKLPSCINPSRLPNLSHLQLSVTTMDEQEMKLLARLPALCYLGLDLRTESTVTTSNINASDGCYFQKLRYFHVNKMVYFEQPNEEDTRISLHIWSGNDKMPFGPRQIHGSSKIVPYAVMPNLEVLGLHVRFRDVKDNNVDCGTFGLEYLPCIRELNGSIVYDGASTEVADAAFAALRNACKVHPNHPTFFFFKFNEAKMASTQDKEDEKQQQEGQMASQEVNNIDLGKQSSACS